MRAQVINVAFHSLLWDLKQCFCGVLSPLLFSSGCLSALRLCLCICVFHKDVWVKNSWEQSGYFIEKCNAGDCTCTPCHPIRYKPQLVLFCIPQPILAFLPLLPLSIFYLLSLPHHTILVDREYRQYIVVWSPLQGSVLFLASFNTGWSLDGTDGISSCFGWKLRCRQTSNSTFQTYFYPILPIWKPFKVKIIF